MVRNIEEQAKYLARESRQAEPAITKVYWFPNDHEVRLVEVHGEVSTTGDSQVHPFYFRPSAEFPWPSCIALIHPDEDQCAELPSDWGAWTDGKVLQHAGEKLA